MPTVHPPSVPASALTNRTVSAPKSTHVAKPAHKAANKAPGKPANKPAIVATAPASVDTNRFYITTAIAYPNGVPHIGHAYEAIATDALARFQRLDGKDVFFLTGTDEHGQKMAQTAEAEKLPTLEVATRNALRFKIKFFSQIQRLSIYNFKTIADRTF